MAEESSFLDFVLNELAAVGAVGMWESRSDFQGGCETRRVLHAPSFPPPFPPPGWELHFFPKPAPRNCSKSLPLACCIRWAASVSLTAAAMRWRTARVSPWRRAGAGGERASKVSSGV